MLQECKIAIAEKETEQNRTARPPRSPARGTRSSQGANAASPSSGEGGIRVVWEEEEKEFYAGIVGAKEKEVSTGQGTGVVGWFLEFRVTARHQVTWI